MFRLEIRADVTNRPAASLLQQQQQTKSVECKNSIDSTTLSQADTRSIGGADNRSLRSYTGAADSRSHVSFNIDNGSVKALAGSICAPRYTTIHTCNITYICTQNALEK